MTATEYLKLYDFFKKDLHLDDSKAKVFVDVVENIVEYKFENEKDNFSSKSDIEKIDFKIELLRQEIKTGFAETKSDLRAEINKLLIWTIATMLTIAGLTIAAIKLLF